MEVFAWIAAITMLIILIVQKINYKHEEEERAAKLKEFSELEQKATNAIKQLDKVVEERRNNEILNERAKASYQNIIKSTQDAQRNLREISATAEQSRQEIKAMADSMEQLAKQELEQRLNNLENMRMTEINARILSAKIKADEEEAACNARIEPLKKELEEYEKKEKAHIEALKREKEIEDNKTFHSVQLSADVKSDIEYIKSIMDKVKHKDLVAKLIWESYLQTPSKEMINRVVGKDKVCGIYKITSMKDKQSYIGQGVDVGKRLTEHLKGSVGIQSIADQRIHHAMADEGVENWIFELLESCEKEQLNEREKYYIGFYKSNEYGYNKTQGNK